MQQPLGHDVRQPRTWNISKRVDVDGRDLDETALRRAIEVAGYEAA